MEELFKIIAHTTECLRLSHQEKVRLRAQLERHIRESSYHVKSPYRHLRSPFQRPSPWYQINRKFAYMVTSFLILTLLGGTGLITAAEAALPGDKLYPVKVNFGEEVRSLLQLNERDRANWDIDRANRRLEEVKELALTGRLDDKTGSQATAYLSEHTASAISRTNSLADHDPEATEEARGRLEATLKTQAIVLDTIKEARNIESLEPIVATASRSAETIDNSREGAREIKQAEAKTKNRKELARTKTPEQKFQELRDRLAVISEHELLYVAPAPEDPIDDTLLPATDTLETSTRESSEPETPPEHPNETVITDDQEIESSPEPTPLAPQDAVPNDTPTEEDPDLPAETVTNTTKEYEDLATTPEEDLHEAASEEVVTPTENAPKETPEITEELVTSTLVDPTDIHAVLEEKLFTMVEQAHTLESDIVAALASDGNKEAIAPLIEEFGQVVRELEQLLILTDELTAYSEEDLAEAFTS